MRILIHWPGNSGFKEEAKKIISKWSEVAKFRGSPQPEYQYAYAESLLIEIAELVLNGLKMSGISVALPEVLVNGNDCNIRATLNEVWQIFWTSKREDFREWEEKQTEALRLALRH